MDNCLENQVTCMESLCWLALILANQPWAESGLTTDNQRVSLHSHVSVIPCRPAEASELWAQFAQHNLLVLE